MSVGPWCHSPGIQRLTQGLAAAVQRFATGTFMLWFPIKDSTTVAPFKAALESSGYGKLLWVEFAVRAPDAEQKLAATGLAILNPPFRLEEQLRTLLPFLAERLMQGAGARSDIKRLAGEQASRGAV